MAVGRRAALLSSIRRNRTPFGALLRGERSCKKLHEDEDILAFRNIKPYAPLAGLVIPKRFVKQDPLGLSHEHLELVQRLKQVAEEIVQREMPAAATARDYWLRFHRPPHISVEHLHLHVVAPVSTIAKWEVIARFCDPSLACDVDDVLARMREEREQVRTE